MSTAFFVIDSLTVAKSHIQGLLTIQTWIFGLAEWGIGLVVIVFLWDRRSSGYLAELRRARHLATPQWRSSRVLKP